jgi:5-amino-6-(5-phospho-D-ribitylamino)uracil phosphatase
MPIRLLALDLDGTLLDPRGQLTERNRRAIAAACASGVRIAVVTGRRFRDARPVALELGSDVTLITHNGALTKHARTLETVAVFPLPLPAALQAIQIGKDAGVGALVSDDHEGLGVLVYDHLSRDNPALLKYIAWARHIHGADGGDNVREIDSLAEYLDHPPVHISFSGQCAAMRALETVLQRELGAAAKVFCTIYSKADFTLLDVLHPEASKGRGVAAAAGALGILQNEVMAVGDNFNDLEMLRYAGTGVVMGNAEAGMREGNGFDGLHLTSRNDEDGVAEAIERFILDSTN